MLFNEVRPVAGRSCGICGLCCKVLPVEALGKPGGAWCNHFAKGSGCTIHGNHPAECRQFLCMWLLEPALDKRWKPSKSHFLLYYVQDGRRVIADVDPAFPNAWKARPYHRTLREWAARGLDDQMQVLAKVGARIHAILPDRDVDLGEVAEGDVIHVGKEMTPDGIRAVARRIPAAEVTPALLAELQPTRRS